MILTIKRVDVFPNGTTVEARKRTLFGNVDPARGTAPPGAAETSAVSDGVSIGPLTLADDTEYVLSGQVGGVWQHIGVFAAAAASSPGGTEPVDLVDRTGRQLGAVDVLELPTAAAVADNEGNPTVSRIAAMLMGWNGTGWYRGRTSPTDAQSLNTILATIPMAFVGVGGDRLRTPNVFKSLASAAITAGTGVTLWTPAASKKFRVMGLALSSSAAGQLLLGDNLVGTIIARSPTLAAGGIWQLGAGDLGNGILSALANNVLKLDGPTGNVAGMVWGIEE